MFDETYFIKNHSPIFGGAIYATGSHLHIYGKIFFLNNSAGDSGGAVCLYLTEMTCYENCTFSNNRANFFGGAIYAIASMVIVTKQLHSVVEWSHLSFVGNHAHSGGAMSLEQNSKVYGLDEYLYKYKILFEANTANRGGAIFVNDLTNSGACSGTFRSLRLECFFQTLYAFGKEIPKYHRQPIVFLHNLATGGGSVLFGGLLDRCTVNFFAKVHVNKYLDVQPISVHGLAYLKTVSNIDNISDINPIASDPVRVCFCRNMHHDCNYAHPVVFVRKGESFNITVVAVNQVNRSTQAVIHSQLSSPEGSVGEGEQTMYPMLARI